MSKIYPYAGFWKRTVAFMIDSVVLTIPTVLGLALLMYNHAASLAPLLAEKNADTPENLAAALGLYAGIFVFEVTIFLFYLLYNACMESSSWQATLGKKCMGIKVIDQHGKRLSFWRATGRTFGKWISSMILYIGFLMAGTTARKQGLHDFMCSTFVVDEGHQPEDPLPAVPTHPVLLGFGIAGLLMLFIMPFVLTGLTIVSALMHAEDVPDSPTVYRHLHAVTTLIELQKDLPETRPTFEEEGFRFSFDKDGIRATPTDSQDFSLLIPDGEMWPCCEAKSGENACDAIAKSTEDAIEKCPAKRE